MADDADIMAEFQEFLTAKRQRETDEQSEEDFEVEIWDKDGRGVRTRRSHAKPFLQSLGIDIDAPTGGEGGDDSGDNDGGKSKPKSGRQSTGPKSGNVTSGGSVARRYFAPKPAK